MKTGWEVKPLGEVCDYARGLTYKKADEVEHSAKRVLRANNIDRDSSVLDYTEIRYLREDFEIPSAKKIERDAVLICTASGSKSHLGKVALVDTDEDFAFGGFMGLITPRKGLLPQFLYYSMTSKSYLDFIARNTDGANINNLKFSQLAEFEIPIPPLEEQRQIVAVLDAAFEGLTLAKENAEANLQNARELFEGSLADEFLRLETQFGNTILSQHSNFKNGFAFKSSRFSDDGEPIVRISNIQSGLVDMAKTVFTKRSDYNEDLSRYEVQPDDLLIAMSGATTGKVGFNRTGKVLLQNQRVGRFSPTPSLRLEYLYYFLSTKIEEHLAISAGAAQPNLSTKQIGNICLPVPPIETQFTFLQRVEALVASVEKLNELYNTRLTDIADLRQSLLQKAFAGQLT